MRTGRLADKLFFKVEKKREERGRGREEKEGTVSLRENRKQELRFKFRQHSKIHNILLQPYPVFLLSELGCASSHC